MQEREFKKMVEKYAEGRANSQEIAAFEKFYQSYQNRNHTYWESWKLRDQDRIQDEIWNNVSQATFLKGNSVNKTNWRYVLRIAAIAVLFMAIGSAVWLSVQPKFHEFDSNGYASRYIRLEDGTELYIKKGATVKVPVPFKDNLREAKLEGEAYFHVVRDKSRPFIVKTGEVSTEVLGTEFNVVQSEHYVSVALIEGSVRLITPEAQEILEPGEKGTIKDKGEKIITTPFNRKDEVAWINSGLVFKNTLLNAVGSAITNRYGIKVLIKDEEIEHYTLTGNFESADLETLITAICKIHNLEYEINENRLEFKGK